MKIKLKNKLDLVEILKRFKKKQPNTCRYVWKRNSKDILFGASPEKLFSFSKPNLTLEALAGTISTKSNFKKLLKSTKDLKEHNYVIQYLIKSLEVSKITNFKKSETPPEIWRLEKGWNFSEFLWQNFSFRKVSEILSFQIIFSKIRFRFRYFVFLYVFMNVCYSLLFIDENIKRLFLYFYMFWIYTYFL